MAFIDARRVVVVVGGGVWLAAFLSTSAATTNAVVTTVNPAAHRTFADDLTYNLYAEPNECSSALGVSMAFSLIYPGLSTTGSDAISQVRDALGFFPPADGRDRDDNLFLAWEDATERMLDGADGHCAGGGGGGGGDDGGDSCTSRAPLLRIANAVWIDNGARLNPTYSSVVGDRVRQIDMGASDSASKVNGWVKNSTYGLIERIVDEGRPLYPPSELVAINSIYLRASWRHPFREGSTNLDAFYTSPSRTSRVTADDDTTHFMHGVFSTSPSSGVSYSHDAVPGFQVIRLPFASSTMSMIIALPMTEGVAAKPVRSSDLIPALENMMTSSSSSARTRVALALPKFRFESSYDESLKSAMMKAGIVAPFRPGSLCGLFDDDDDDDGGGRGGGSSSSSCGSSSLFVDRVVQKTVIDVNELGIEAASATAVMVGRGIPPADEPVLMMCDHPFQFYVYDEAEDVVLFEGRVGRPEAAPVQEGEPGEVVVPPLLGSRHSDDDFWTNAFRVDPVDPPANPTESPALELGEPPAPSEPLTSIGRYVTARNCFSLVVGALLIWALGFVML